MIVPEEGVPVTVKPAGGGPAGFIAVLARATVVSALPVTGLRTWTGAPTTGALGTSAGVATATGVRVGGAAGGAAGGGSAGGVEGVGGAAEAVLAEGVVTLMLLL